MKPKLKRVHATDPACPSFVRATAESRRELARLREKCGGDTSKYARVAATNPDEFPVYSRLLGENR